MPHQGNIYLDYGLVLLVKPLTETRDQPVRLPWKRTTRAIQAHATWHLLARFHKDTHSRGKAKQNRQAVRRFLAEWLRVQSIRGLDKVRSLSIGDRHPKVWVLVYVEPVSVGDDRLSFDSFRDAVRKKSPCTHVEQFCVRVGCVTEHHVRRAEDAIGSGAPGNPDDQDGMYHLASRICSAFVEYRRFWGKKRPTDVAK